MSAEKSIGTILIERRFWRGWTTPTPTFVPDAQGTYSVSLAVNDGHLDSQTDTVSVFVQPPPKIEIHPEEIDLKSRGGSKSITAVLTSPALSSFSFFTAPDGVTVTAQFNLENRYVDKDGNQVVFMIPADAYPGGYKVVQVRADGDDDKDGQEDDHGYRQKYLYRLTLKFNRDLLIAGFTDPNGNLMIIQRTNLTSTVIGNDLSVGSDTNKVDIPPKDSKGDK